MMYDVIVIGGGQVGLETALHLTKLGRQVTIVEMQADIALKESQGELHRLKTEIAAGQYISVEEVKLDYAKFFVVFKKFAMSIPARVTGMLSGQMEPSELRRCEKEIAAEVNRLLGAFVIAGIVGPEDVKKDGTLKEEKNTDS